jgi:hypothetical protein
MPFRHATAQIAEVLEAYAKIHSQSSELLNYWRDAPKFNDQLGFGKNTRLRTALVNCESRKSRVRRVKPCNDGKASKAILRFDLEGARCVSLLCVS